MIRLKELDHFGIEVSDLERSRRFYVDFLGMEFLQSLGSEGILLRCGGHNIALHLRSTMHPAPVEIIENPLGKAHHAFKVSSENFSAALEAFVRRGVPTHGPVDWGDHDCLYFLDPDGNLLELVQHR
jgi:catechol 2,3-dioxygenase-like lactoylglutathione lyase family enzyme